MNGPTEREHRWQQILRDHFPRPANLMTMRKPALALMAEADRESAALRARVAVLEQQIAAIEAECLDAMAHQHVPADQPIGPWVSAHRIRVLAAGVADNPTEGSPL